MHKHAYPKMMWLREVESALKTYQQQSSLTEEKNHLEKTLRRLEHQINDTKSLIRHSRLGHDSVMNTTGAFGLPVPAVRHNHTKALHQYRRKLNHYEHVKEMLRKDGITA